jgi:hypothetical protein
VKNPVGRWAVAAAVTGSVFGLATWLAGAYVLPLWVGDDGSRWVIATAAGVVLGGLAALWGKVFATARPEERTSASLEVTALGARSIAVGGNFAGAASTDGGMPPESRGVRGQSTATEPAAAEPGPRTVTAGGERSIAIGGSASGVVSTGDHADAARG